MEINPKNPAIINKEKFNWTSDFALIWTSLDFDGIADNITITSICLTAVAVLTNTKSYLTL